MFGAPFGTIRNAQFHEKGGKLFCTYDYVPLTPVRYIELTCLVSRTRVPWRVELKRRKRAKYWRTHDARRGTGARPGR